MRVEHLEEIECRRSKIEGGAPRALPLPVRNERGEGLGEGYPTADTPTYLQARTHPPQPSPPSAGGEGEETGAVTTSARLSKAFASARPPSSARGFLLLECLVYIGGLALVLGLAYAAFYRTMGNWQGLSRNSADIVRTLQAGERWRADVRSATAPPRLVEFAQETIFHVPQAQGEILYAFREGSVFRRAPSSRDWQPLLPKVKNFKMQIDHYESVTAWRWEVELQSAQKAAHVKPLFTFLAVTANKPRP